MRRRPGRRLPCGGMRSSSWVSSRVFLWCGSSCGLTLARPGLQPNHMSSAGDRGLRSFEQTYDAVIDGEPEHLTTTPGCLDQIGSSQHETAISNETRHRLPYLSC